MQPLLDVQTPYLHFIMELVNAFPTRPMVLLEARHVSVGLHLTGRTTDAMADAAADILAKHGWQQAAFMGHSYGTFVLSRMAQMYRPLIQSMVRPCAELMEMQAVGHVSVASPTLAATPLTELCGLVKKCTASQDLYPGPLTQLYIALCELFLNVVHACHRFCWTQYAC